MKIVIISGSKQQQGGVERFGFYLEKALKENPNDEISLIGREDLGPFQQLILRSRIALFLEQPLLGYFLGSKAKSLGFDLCITSGMLGWNVRSGKLINVSHGTWAQLALRVDRGRSFLKYFIKRYVWGSFAYLSMRHASLRVAVSAEVKEGIERYYGIRDAVVISNASDTSLFAPTGAAKKNQAIFVGRFEHAKGKEILEDLKEYLKGKNWNLLVPQNFSQEELAVAYNESRIFLLPSLHEGCSYALLDAMACGLPFLASPVGMVPDLVRQGLFPECIVDEQSVGAYVKKLEHLMSLSADEQAKLSRELRDYILKFHSIPLFNERYQKLVRELV